MGYNKKLGVDGTKKLKKFCPQHCNVYVIFITVRLLCATVRA